MALTIATPEPAPKCFCGKPRQVLSKMGSKRTYFLTCSRHNYNDWEKYQEDKKELTKHM